MPQSVKANTYTNIDKNTVKVAIGDFDSLSKHPDVTGSSGIKHRLLSEIRPRLTAILQTSLDLDEILAIFYEEIGHFVSIESVHYRHDREGVSILNSKNAQEEAHKVSFSLLTSGDQVGLLRFSRKEKFKQQEIKLLEEASKTLVYPARNALRYKEALRSALTDSLTQVGNRLAFDSALQKEIEVSSRYEQPLSILILDIDKFKLVNDQYGHAAGDEILKQIATALAETCRQADEPYRFGGEEFTVILNKTCLKGAMIMAERLRANVEKLTCIIDDHQAIPVTISVGVASYKANESRPEFIARADSALYRAKALGRNRVISSQDSEA